MSLEFIMYYRLGQVINVILFDISVVSSTDDILGNENVSGWYLCVYKYFVHMASES